MHPRRRSALVACSCTMFLVRSALAMAAETESTMHSDARWPTATAAQGRASSQPVSPAGQESGGARSRRARAEKRFVVARDFGVAIPVGPFADVAAAMYGPILRLAFHPSERFEVGVRAGYQRGLDKQVGGATGSLSSLPMYATARWFPVGDRSGPYTGLALGANVFRKKTAPRTSFWDVGADSTWVRPSANVGVGWVWSRSLPIDLRLQLASLDLVSEEGLASMLAIGVSGGYSIFF